MAFLSWHVFVGLDTEGMVALWASAVTLTISVSFWPLPGRTSYGKDSLRLISRSGRDHCDENL